MFPILGEASEKVNASRKLEEESIRMPDEDEGDPNMSMSLMSLDDGVRGGGGMQISLFSGRGQSDGGDDCDLPVLM